MMCRRVQNSGQNAMELRMGSSQAAFVLLALITSATPVRGALWCEGGGSKWIDRGLGIHPDDLKALEALRDGMKVTNNLLDNWNNSSHPCEWCGVLCMCNVQTYPSYLHQSCPEGAEGGRYPDVERVFGIDLSSGARPSGLGLTGPLPTEIGLLTEAKMLYFDGNTMTGTLPSGLGRLRNLVRLLLRHTSFTGTLPPELGYTRLKDLHLDGNQLEGSIPPSYCNLTTAEDAFPLASFVLIGNKGLCGVVPDCFNASVTLPGVLAGTCLLHPLHPSGGPCDKTAPECKYDQPEGCLTTPDITRRLDLIRFNVSGFVDAESGIKAIRWRLGTEPGLQDAMAETPNLPPDVLTLQYNSSTVHLVNGLRYYVTVTVVNGACPEVTSDFSSAAILADSTPPEPVIINDRAAVYMSADCTHTKLQKDLTQLNVCWAEFEEKESSVAKYEVQFVRTDDDGVEKVIEEFSAASILCVGGFCKTSRQMDLKPNSFYSVVVRAYNLQASFKDVPSSDLRIPGSGEPVSVVLKLLVLTSISTAFWLLMLVYTEWLKRHKRVQAQLEIIREREVLEQDLQLTFEACIEGSSVGTDGTGVRQSAVSAMGSAVDIFTLKEVVFVFTDIEDSTAMSAVDPVAMKHVQKVHDGVIRHQIALNNGYETNTQGDSFEVAFGNVHSATRFCLAVQLDLLHAAWSANVLRLPSCGEGRNYNGKLVFAGPRVRMGIHIAKEGTFSIYRHHLTKHVQFSGPAVKLAARIGDSAAGGQIVMSVETLYSNERAVMKLAVLKLLGQFMFEVPPQDPVQVGVFSVLPPALGKMPARDFRKPLRGCMMVEMGEGLQLVPPPVSKDHGLAVVMICMEEAPDAVNKAIVLHAASFAQQFHGYKLVQTDSRQLVYMFQIPLEAVHFGMVLQVALMAAPWETMTPADLCIERNQQGKIIYRGPRVSVLVHSSHDIAVDILRTPPGSAKTPPGSAETSLSLDKLENPGERSFEITRRMPFPRSARKKLETIDIEVGIDAIDGNAKGNSKRGNSKRGLLTAAPGGSMREPRLTRSSNQADYSGVGLRDAEVLSALVHPGQLVVTEAVWKAVQGGLPTLAQVISLGVHEVPDLSDALPQTLTEISPSGISQRSFRQVPSRKCLVPGFRQAPKVHEDLTSMFCNVMGCPAAPEGVDREEFTLAYDTSVMLWSELVRRLLTEFNGYECKEPERGKFTLVFKNFKNSVGFAVTIQSALMDLDYPPVLLKAEEFMEVRLETDDTLLYRGLRVKIGMAHGRASLKKPIRSTGRADYYGILPNTAARLMSVAPAGQILTDGTYLHEMLDLAIPCASVLLKTKEGSAYSSSRLSKLRERTHTGGHGSALFSTSTTSSPSSTLKPSADSVGSRSASGESGGCDDCIPPLTRFDQRASQFERELAPIDTAAGPVGPLMARGCGVYALKGVPEAKPLVQLSLMYLRRRRAQPDAQRA